MAACDENLGVNGISIWKNQPFRLTHSWIADVVFVAIMIMRNNSVDDSDKLLQIFQVPPEILLNLTLINILS